MLQHVPQQQANELRDGVHLWQIAGQMRREDDLLRALRRTVIASIGPTTSEELRRHGFVVDFEPSHPKMGVLIRETAERAGDLVRTKREGDA